MLHTPWHTNFPISQNFLANFNGLLKQNKLPDFVLIPLLHVKAAYESKIHFSEPTNTSNDPITPFLSPLSSTDLQEVIMLSNMLPSNDTSDSDAFQDLDFGLNYDWSQKHFLQCDTDNAKTFLQDAIKKNSESTQNTIDIPVKSDGKPYNLNDLTEEQQGIASEVLLTIKNCTSSRGPKPKF